MQLSSAIVDFFIPWWTWWYAIISPSNKEVSMESDTQVTVKACKPLVDLLNVFKYIACWNKWTWLYASVIVNKWQLSKEVLGHQFWELLHSLLNKKSLNCLNMHALQYDLKLNFKIKCIRLHMFKCMHSFLINFIINTVFDYIWFYCV